MSICFLRQLIPGQLRRISWEQQEIAPSVFPLRARVISGRDGSSYNDFWEYVPADTTTDPLTSTAQTNVALDTVYTSNTIAVSGIDAATPISISGWPKGTIPTYSINGGSYRNASGTVSNGNTVTVHLRSSGSYSTKKSATLTIGGVPGTFSLTTKYGLRDIGPTGGWIFYDKGSYSNGWRYLEAAPEDQTYLFDHDAKWGKFGYDVPGAEGTSIGTGYQNTIDIVTNDHLISGAAARCARYSIKKDGVTYDDWFLPSKDELHYNLKRGYGDARDEHDIHYTPVGGFADQCYWSSSEIDSYDVWGVGFWPGVGSGFARYYSKNVKNPIIYSTACHVRAARRF